MRADFDQGRNLGARAPRDPSRRLLASLADLAGGHGMVTRHSERPWASITFAGARHAITMSFSGHEAAAAGERFVAALPDHEFAIPGHLVADIAVRSVDHVLLPTPQLTIAVEVLLLEDGGHGHPGPSARAKRRGSHR